MTYPKGKMIKGTIGFYETRQIVSNIIEKTVNNENELKKDKNKEKVRFSDKMHFYGIFGSFFFFNEIFNFELLSKIFLLGPDYELILYRNFNFFSNIDPKKFKIIKSIGEIEISKIENKLVCLISPKVNLIYSLIRQYMIHF